MRRDTDAGRVRDMVHLLRRYGIESGMFIMLGYEGEEMADIEATVEHLKRSDPDLFLTTVAYPIKGTPYYAEVEERLEAPRPWAESTERDLGIRGRRPRAWFDLADRLLRAEVALERLRVAPAGSTDPGAGAGLRLEVEAARAGLRRLEQHRPDEEPLEQVVHQLVERIEPRDVCHLSSPKLDLAKGYRPMACK